MITGQRVSKKVLLCGHRSFAAQGLIDLLDQAGHDVVCFSRGSLQKNDRVVTGPVYELHNNQLLDSFDTVINYILLGDESLRRNLDYVDSLLQFCSDHNVKHLVHISSVAVYKNGIKLVNEHAKVEIEPRKKDLYGALKVATEQHIVKGLPPGVKLSLVRPALILGSGLDYPIRGNALRLPWNRLLAVGNCKSQLGLITRELVNEAILRIVAQPPEERLEVLLLADNDSHTRQEYLDACCKILGYGTGVHGLPVPFWLVAGPLGEVLVRLVGKRQIEPLKLIRAWIQKYSFDSTQTQRRLGMNFTIDWRHALRQSVDGQEPNFRITSVPPRPDKTNASTITFIGFGGVVKQYHLPALKHLGFNGRVKAYDLRARSDDSGHQVDSLSNSNLEAADLFVVASPGPVHTDAIPLLQSVNGPIVVEKPLCYTPAELEKWEAFAAARASGVYVCHNVRFKSNVLAMISFLSRFNPGRLHHVDVLYQTPPLTTAAPQWARNERQARTLLMDRSIHLLDLACMFEEGEWEIINVRYRLNGQGQTSLIEGQLTSKNYLVNYLLRQDVVPRRIRMLYVFQNYSVSLGFSPDTFVVQMADDNPWLYVQEASSAVKITRRRIVDRLTGHNSDVSHAIVFAAAIKGEDDYIQGLTVRSLAPFYRMMFQIGEHVYGTSDK